MKEKQTITAVIPAKNEEENIGRCLASLTWCDKVQVLWMGEDNTGAIAKRYGAEVVKTKSGPTDDFVQVQKNINWAIENATTDWILRIDADEEVTGEMAKEVLQILNSQTSTVAYGVPRRQFFWGGFLTGGDWAYDRLVRLFRPEFARYDHLVPVHEQFNVTGRIGYLKYPLNHFSHPTLTEALRKFNSYTSLEASVMKMPQWLAGVKMFVVPVYVFLRWMVWHQGWRDGLRGVVAGLFRSFYVFLLFAKYLERQFLAHPVATDK